MSKPADLGSLKIGRYIVIDNEPCKIVEYEKSKPGKHGSAKARIVAISAFTGQKKNIVSPVNAKINIPIIEKRPAQVLSIMGDSIQLMDMEDYSTFETTIIEEEELRSKISPGAEVEYWIMMDRKKIIRIK
jgi:translation initiation factor 5A